MRRSHSLRAQRIVSQLQQLLIRTQRQSKRLSPQRAGSALPQSVFINAGTLPAPDR